MIEPKIYAGPQIDTNSDYDVYIFLPEGFTGSKEGEIAKARLKYIELYERQNSSKNYQTTRVVPSNSQRPKRKRIVR